MADVTIDKIPIHKKEWRVCFGAFCMNEYCIVPTALAKADLIVSCPPMILSNPGLFARLASLVVSNHTQSDKPHH